MKEQHTPLYLFILWQNGRIKEKEFLDDVKKKFDIFQIYEVTWREEDFAPSLARFYGKKLPKGCKKEKDTGCGSFLVILFFDNNEDITEKGVNRNVIRAKAEYRKFLGGNLLHASDSPIETNENILFLFGKNINAFLNEPAFDKIKPYNKSIVGFPFWQNTDEALNIIKKCPNTTVDVSKNIPVIHTQHIDMIKRLLNAQKTWWWFNRYVIMTTQGAQPIYIKK